MKVTYVTTEYSPLMATSPPMPGLIITAALPDGDPYVCVLYPRHAAGYGVAWSAEPAAVIVWSTGPDIGGPDGGLTHQSWEIDGVAGIVAEKLHLDIKKWQAHIADLELAHWSTKADTVTVEMNAESIMKPDVELYPDGDTFNTTDPAPRPTHARFMAGKARLGNPAGDGGGWYEIDYDTLELDRWNALDAASHLLRNRAVTVNGTKMRLISEHELNQLEDARQALVELQAGHSVQLGDTEVVAVPAHRGRFVTNLIDGTSAWHEGVEYILISRVRHDRLKHLDTIDVRHRADVAIVAHQVGQAHDNLLKLLDGWPHPGGRDR